MAITDYEFRKAVKTIEEYRTQLRRKLEGANKIIPSYNLGLKKEYQYPADMLFRSLVNYKYTSDITNFDENITIGQVAQEVKAYIEGGRIRGFRNCGPVKMQRLVEFISKCEIL